MLSNCGKIQEMAVEFKRYFMIYPRVSSLLLSIGFYTCMTFSKARSRGKLSVHYFPKKVVFFLRLVCSSKIMRSKFKSNFELKRIFEIKYKLYIAILDSFQFTDNTWQDNVFKLSWNARFFLKDFGFNKVCRKHIYIALQIHL